jgi:hypothetical protein
MLLLTVILLSAVVLGVVSWAIYGLDKSVDPLV